MALNLSSRSRTILRSSARLEIRTQIHLHLGETSSRFRQLSPKLYRADDFCHSGKSSHHIQGADELGGPLQDHSHKPEEVYSIIERCSEGDYLELFARRPVPSDKNWVVWGNEIKTDIVIPNYPVPDYSQNARETNKGGENE